MGTCNLASVISNFAEFPALDKIQNSIQFSSRWTLQFINSISNDFQKLLKYFNRTTIFASFTELFPSLWFTVFPTRAAFYLNEWELLIVKSALLAEISSHLNCHKRPELRYIQSNCIWALQFSALSVNVSLITFLHIKNGAQFLSAISVSMAAFTVILPVTKTNYSE